MSTKNGRYFKMEEVKTNLTRKIAVITETTNDYFYKVNRRQNITFKIFKS